MTAHKPDGYSSVSPYPVVEDASQVIDFMEETFDATECRRFDAPDGSLLHAEFQIDDAVVMISEGGEEFPPFPSLVHVYVLDIDATYGRAIEAGGVVIEEPTQQADDPDRRGTVRDPAGNTWAIATQVE